MYALCCNIQSHKHDPTHMLRETDNFFEKTYGPILSSMTDEEYQQKVDSVIKKTLEKEKEMFSQSNIYWNEIENRQYKFDRKQLLVECFKTITKQDIVDFFNNFILPTGENYRRVAVMMFSKNHPIDHDQISTYNPEHNIVYVRDYMEFKETLAYYPSKSEF